MRKKKGEKNVRREDQKEKKVCEKREERRECQKSIR